MNADKPHNNPPTAATSPSAHETNGRLSEATFLELQANDAQAAFLNTLNEAKGSLATAADVRLWTERHPWVMVSLAAALGFTAAATVVPGKDEKFGEKMSRLGEKVKPSPKPQQATVADSEPPKQSLLGKFIESLFDTLQVTLQTAIISALQTPPDTTESSAATSSAPAAPPPHADSERAAGP